MDGTIVIVSGTWLAILMRNTRTKPQRTWLVKLDVNINHESMNGVWKS